MLTIKTGDLLEATEQYITHQTNCISNSASGIAYHLFKKFPYADIYKNRTHPDNPGDIIIRGNGTNNRYIINLNGQKYPGNIINDIKDNKIARQKYFLLGLNKIEQISDLTSIAFNWKIGSGLAGGDWNWYLNQLIDFSDRLQAKNDNIKVSIYKRKEDD